MYIGYEKSYCVYINALGETFHYDLCVSLDSPYKVDMKKFKYLGCGKIYSVDGILQNFTDECYFYKYA